MTERMIYNTEKKEDLLNLVDTLREGDIVQTGKHLPNLGFMVDQRALLAEINNDNGRIFILRHQTAYNYVRETIFDAEGNFLYLPVNSVDSNEYKQQLKQAGIWKE
ncbi:MAG TPA: hypothetical protein VJB35_01175 [Candidatus Nanoarchaeia archaeon]|nr:hypothetical protein [Candidatus Nanoarchaeia archaeon]